jgi:hypothetical protein
MAISNPLMVNPSSLLALCIFAFWTLEIDAVVVALLLSREPPRSRSSLPK